MYNLVKLDFFVTLLQIYNNGASATYVHVSQVTVGIDGTSDHHEELHLGMITIALDSLDDE